MKSSDADRATLAVVVLLALGLLLWSVVALAGYTSVEDQAPCSPVRTLRFQCPDPQPERPWR